VKGYVFLLLQRKECAVVSFLLPHVHVNLSFPECGGKRENTEKHGERVENRKANMLCCRTMIMF